MNRYLEKEKKEDAKFSSTSSSSLAILLEETILKIQSDSMQRLLENLYISQIVKALKGSSEMVRDYILSSTTERKLSESAVHIVYSSLKFLYTKTMGLNWNADKIPGIKVGKKLPAVLSQSEIKEILKVTENLKHKAILMTIYAAGLRISEASKLEISDIDSKNMQIKVREGKGKKDRYTILSETNLEILREYWKRYKPKVYLFPGMDSSKSISVRAIQLAFSDAVKKAHIKKHVSVHTLRHYVESDNIEIIVGKIESFILKDDNLFDLEDILEEL